MRYATVDPSSAGQARSRRVGRCARCHAPVLADEEFYGHGAAIVHGACGNASPGSLDEAGDPRAAAASGRPRLQQARRLRRMVPVTGLAGPASTEKP
jgi:hypothetical protein